MSINFSVLTWNVRSEKKEAANYLSHILDWSTKNYTSGKDIDFILLQETGVRDNYFQSVIGDQYQILKVLEGKTSGDNYFFAIHKAWNIDDQGYVDTFDPKEAIGVRVRPAYKLCVSQGGIHLELYNFHNAFDPKGGSYACLEMLEKQVGRINTIVAGDFNLESSAMTGLFRNFSDASNHYDHILTSLTITYQCSIALDSDDDGLPFKDEEGDSINGSDHCAVLGCYSI